MPIERLFGLVFAGMLGAALGSFANVLILRWHEDSSIMGRSACPDCRKTLRPKHLVPILSWIFLRGKCADCGKKIHWQYPLVEAAAALIGVLVALRFQPFLPTEAPRFWFEFIICIALLVPVVMDLRWKELPVEFLAGLGFFAAVWNVLGFGVLDPMAGTVAHLGSLFLGIAVPVVFFGLQVVISRETWLGQGDVWLGAFMGAALGWPKIGMALYLAYVIGGVFAGAALFTGKMNRGDRLPFGPLLALGTVLTLWYGDPVFTWLSKYF